MIDRAPVYGTPRGELPGRSPTGPAAQNIKGPPGTCRTRIGDAAIPR
jgi:hypothetical protein